MALVRGEANIEVVFVDGVPRWPGRTLLIASPMMRGADVKAWQAKLKQRGWTIDVDGVFGPQSRGVCRGYQKATGLPATGQVDRATWDMTWSWKPPAETTKAGTATIELVAGDPVDE
jgi:peptidoglycan hydrolase-like protein with peptidoglycan-binding domain